MGTVTYYAMMGNVKQQEGTNLQLFLGTAEYCQCFTQQQKDRIKRILNIFKEKSKMKSDIL
jgi:hypothetical protein